MKSVTEIIMDDFIVFSSAKQAGEAETEHVGTAATSAEHSEHAPAEQEEAPAEVKETPSSKSEVINPDDIPF